jgi:hypothetical protein
MSLGFHLNDACPKCGKPLLQAVIELHPTRSDRALHDFTCANCGPIKTKIISLKPGEAPLEVTAWRIKVAASVGGLFSF